MKRRTLGLAFAGLAVAALAIGAGAVAGLQPANLDYTPNSEGQMTNIDVARRLTPRTTTATHSCHDRVVCNRRPGPHPLNQEQQLRGRGALGGRNRVRTGSRARAKVHEQSDRARCRRHDADDVELRALLELGLQPDDERELRRPDEHRCAAIRSRPSPETCSRAHRACSSWSTRPMTIGYAIFWITGRGDSQHQATIANLQNDASGRISRTSRR